MSRLSKSAAWIARWLSTSLTLAVSLLTIACSTLLPVADDSRIERSWSGRFALTVTVPEQPSQAHAGNFTLTQGAGFTQLDLSSPLGNVIASARNDAAGATLITADGRRVDAAEPEQLTEQLFGWRVPFQRLPDWLRGRPATVVSEISAPDGQTRPLRATDAGWQLNYEQWSDRQPSRMLIVYPERVNLRLVLRTE